MKVERKPFARTPLRARARRSPDATGPVIEGSNAFAFGLLRERYSGTILFLGVIGDPAG